MKQVAHSLNNRILQIGLSCAGTGNGSTVVTTLREPGRDGTAVPGQATALLATEAVPGVGPGKGEAAKTGWLGRGSHPSGIISSPERLHFWWLLAALAAKPVHVLGGRPHHLVCLQLALVLCTIHL